MKIRYEPGSDSAQSPSIFFEKNSGKVSQKGRHYSKAGNGVEIGDFGEGWV